MSDADKNGDDTDPSVEDFLGKLFAGEALDDQIAVLGENALAIKLRQRIQSEGPITLHDYMEACLADPEHGYYLVRDPFGTGGDFITAPDVCQIFGELLGLWCVHVWAELGMPKNCKLVELGPGRGALMGDALRAASLVPDFLQSVEVHFVETSKALCAAQEEHLRSQAEEQERELPKLFWHDRLADVPDGPTFLIANEFLDALPIRQFQFKGGQWYERMIALDENEGFIYALADQPHDEQASFPPIHKQAGENDFLELCPARAGVVRQMAARANGHPFAGVLIDYGYGEPALGDSFQAIKSHEFTDPLEEPGLADVTAHVDFAHVLDTGREYGLTGHGPVSQRDFLVSLGVRERAAQLMENMENMFAAQQFMIGLQRLIEPDQMGTLFKVVAFTGTDQPEVPGFEDPSKDNDE